MTQRVPAEVFPPGEFIREELEARGWTQGVLAEVMARPERTISEIISGKRAITPETARGLSAALGPSPGYWLNLEGAYRLSKTEHSDEDVRKRSAIYGYAPIREMIRRGWIAATESVAELERQVLAHFGVSSLEERPSFCGAAKATAAPVTMAQMAWAFRVRQIASRTLVPKYSEQSLRNAIAKMRSLLREPSDVAQVPTILAACGIRFVIVEPLPSGKIDGITFWLDNNESPVVGMSMRFDRIDNFWFVLRHELDHVLRMDGIEEAMFDVDLERECGESTDDREKLANEAASDFCIPKPKMDCWIARKSPFFSELDLLGFAKVQDVHPGIVAGQLRHRIKRHDIFAKYLVKIREALLTSAAVDGWGQVRPTIEQEQKR
ncbi:MAG: HigA family addiction module antitoxin [Polyangia bacterium]